MHLLFKRMEVTKLMIVADPDDEVVFAGEELLSEQGWMVLSITHKSDPIRSIEFASVMEKLGCEYQMWDYKDNWG